MTVTIFFLVIESSIYELLIINSDNLCMDLVTVKFVNFIIGLSQKMLVIT